MIFSGNPLVVIGHRRPDLDSIAAAMGYAALLTELGEKALAARSGPLDEQSSWALSRWGLAGPELLLDTAPTFADVARHEPAFPPTVSLAEAIERIALGARAIPIVDPAGAPLALVDARACVHLLGQAGAQAGRTGSEEAIRSAVARAALPLLCDGRLPPALERPLVMSADERVDERRGAVVRADPDDFLVVDGAGRYLGIASRADLLAPPKARLVLVDHNELGQSVPGAEHAEIVEVLDHHRLGNATTLLPIPFAVDVVGSTATLVAERWRRFGKAPSCPLAGLMLGAVLSDTLGFRSPTTTARDREAAARLAELSGVRDLDEHARELITAGAGLGHRPAQEIVEEDLKEYDSAAGRVLVGQAEVRAFREIPPRADELSDALERLRQGRGAVLALLMLTDPVRAQSRMIALGEPKLLRRLPYPRAADGLYDAGAVVSRKTQLVPTLLHALAED
jgi:manganese-dependent inorganic pyrophosphatase